MSGVSRKTDESFPIDFTVPGFQEEPMLDAKVESFMTSPKVLVC